MSIKRILLPINGRDDIAAVAHLAFDVARKVRAEVEVLHPFTPYYEVISTVGEGGSPVQFAHDIEQAPQRIVTALKVADGVGGHGGLSNEKGAVARAFDPYAFHGYLA